MAVRRIEFAAPQPQTSSLERGRLMAGLTSQERLQPSLLDRLTDDQPTELRESLDARVLNKQQLRAAVLRDLSWLFNTTRAEPDPEQRRPGALRDVAARRRTPGSRSSTTAFLPLSGDPMSRHRLRGIAGAHSHGHRPVRAAHRPEDARRSRCQRRRPGSRLPAQQPAPGHQGPACGTSRFRSSCCSAPTSTSRPARPPCATCAPEAGRAMDPRLLRYYNQELRYLREMGGEFAREFPKIAGRLGMEGMEVADPYVERLIEGCRLPRRARPAQAGRRVPAAVAALARDGLRPT